jgi:hypothetical protein
VTILAMVISPLIFIACVICAEKCIHSDGLPNDSARAAGQWGFLVQILVVIVAALSEASVLSRHQSRHSENQIANLHS